MNYPIEPIMNDMSQFNKQQHVVTQDFTQAKTFIQAFAQRLRCFAQSSRTFEASTAPVVYAKNEKDITEMVIKSYDKKFPN